MMVILYNKIWKAKHGMYLLQSIRFWTFSLDWNECFHKILRKWYFKTFLKIPFFLNSISLIKVGSCVFTLLAFDFFIFICSSVEKYSNYCSRFSCFNYMYWKMTDSQTDKQTDRHWGIESEEISVIWRRPSSNAWSWSSLHEILRWKVCSLSSSHTVHYTSPSQANFALKLNTRFLWDWCFFIKRNSSCCQ